MTFQSIYNPFKNISDISSFLYEQLDVDCVNCENDHIVIKKNNLVLILLDYVEVRLDSDLDVIGVETDYIQVQIGMTDMQYIAKEATPEVVSRVLTEILK